MIVIKIFKRYCKVENGVYYRRLSCLSVLLSDNDDFEAFIDEAERPRYHIYELATKDLIFKKFYGLNSATIF